MGDTWDGDARAVVPPDHLRASRDVLVVTGEDSAMSPYPLGLGVYTWLPHKGSKERPLRLLFVSERVERDRSPSEDRRNGPGVRAGWYVVARDSMPFSVRITRVNRNDVGFYYDDCLVSSLKVDGIRTNSTSMFPYLSKLSGDEVTERGFVEKRVGDQSFNFEQTVRPFFFEKVDSKEEVCRNTNAGSIKLRVAIGGAWLRNETETAKTKKYELRNKSVSEKDVAKDGKSLKVSRDSDVIHQKGKLCKYKFVGARALREASVTIFVREKAWLRSRRLIDDAGNPCTYEKYTELLRKDNPVDKGNTNTDSDAKGPVRKRAKLQEDVVRIEEARPAELTELTYHGHLYF